MTEFVIDSRNRQETEQLLSKLSVSLNAKPGRYRIKVAKFVKRGTDAQRRYYHVAAVPLLIEYEREQGNIRSHDEVHCFFKHLFRAKVPVINPVSGEVIAEEPKAGGNMSVNEWCEYIDMVIAWLGDLGIKVQPPTQWYERPVQV